MIAALLASGSLILAAQAPLPQVSAQESPAVSSPASSVEPTVLSDVSSDGRRVAEIADAYVEAVAAPARRRGLARWYGTVCVGVVNVRPDIAQPLIDHISGAAMDLGLRAGAPGCNPNIIVVFADDGARMASAMVEQNRRVFHLGVGGLDRGKVALRAFQAVDKPVRWWHVSMPTVGERGGRAIRMPGDTGAPYVRTDGIVNRGRSVTDSMSKAIVVVDIDQIQETNLVQLGDYLVMVTLAQIDLEGSTDDLVSVLNLFQSPTQNAGLTEWDQTYLDVLYRSLPERVNPSRQSSDLARRITRMRRANAAASSAPD